MARSGGLRVGAARIDHAVLLSTPYLLGLAAALDPSGRWAAAGGSVYLFGFAAGPLLAGSVIATGGYPGLAAVCVGLMVPVWVLALVVNRRLHASNAEADEAIEIAEDRHLRSASPPRADLVGDRPMSAGNEL